MIEKAYILYIDDPKSIAYAEDCKKSCEEHGVPYEMFQGYKGLTIEDLAKKTGWAIGRKGHEQGDRQYVREYNAALGHIEIWRKIAASDKPAALLEHDAIVKKNFCDLDPPEDVFFLGPRVDSRDDYEFPEGRSDEFIEIRRHEGAHAYVLTPTVARYLLVRIEEERRLLPTEGLISVRNPYKLKFVAIDPPYVVCELGKRKSFTAHNEKTGRINFRNFSGLLAGMKDESKALAENDYKFSVDWFSGNIPHIEKTLKLVGKKKGDKIRILEIGAFEGKSTCWFSDNLLDHPESLLVTVDTFEGSVEHSADEVVNLHERFMGNLILSRNPEKVKPFRAASQDALPYLATQQPNLKFDMIYIDGSHETLDVVVDAHNSLRLLAPDGVIIFDDYLWKYNGDSPVKHAVDFFDKHAPVKPILVGYQVSFIRKAP